MFTGLPPEVRYGWGWLSLIHPEDVERAQCEWEQASAAGLQLETEWRVRRADGAYRWLAIRGVPLRDAAGVVWRWVGTCTDIEDAKQLVAELRRSQQETAESLALLEALQATAPVGFAFMIRSFGLCGSTGLLQQSAAFRSMSRSGSWWPGWSRHWPELERVYRAVLDEGATFVGREIAGPSACFGGAIRHWLCSFHPVQLEGEVAGIGVVASDITERKQAEEFRSTVMGNMAEGVYALDSSGKVMFMNRAASQMLAWTEDELRGKPMHRIIHFQNADGTLHPERDCALLRVRTEAHYERVVEDTFTRKDGTTFPVSYSAAPLLDVNDGSGTHGVVVVFRDVSEELAERHRVERELAGLAWVGRIRDALDEDRFVLYSQPIVALGDADDREELLLRMIGRDGELITPLNFLPAAEKYGLIKEIDRWVIRMAIRHVADGRCVHVNLSAASMGDPDLLRLIEDELNSTGADPARLTFELTETAVLNDVKAGVRFTTSITALGCRLALDDFGTGFASFTYLKRLPSPRSRSTASSSTTSRRTTPTSTSFARSSDSRKASAARRSQKASKTTQPSTCSDASEWTTPKASSSDDPHPPDNRKPRAVPEVAYSEPTPPSGPPRRDRCRHWPAPVFRNDAGAERRHSHVGDAVASGRFCSPPRAVWTEVRVVIVSQPAVWGAARRSNSARTAPHPHLNRATPQGTAP